MNKGFVKFITLMALTLIIVGNMTTVAMAHHSHSSDRAPQSTSCHQNSSCHQSSRCNDDAYCNICGTCHNDTYAYCDICEICHNDTYCDAYGIYHDGAHCVTDDTYCNEAVCEGRKHHARFYCGSREEYYSRKNCKLNCY